MSSYSGPLKKYEHLIVAGIKRGYSCLDLARMFYMNGVRSPYDWHPQISSGEQAGIMRLEMMIRYIANVNGWVRRNKVWMEDVNGDWKARAKARRDTIRAADRAEAERVRALESSGTACRTLYFSKHYTIADAGIRAGEIIGHRAWIIENGYLKSFNGALWMPGQHMRGDLGKGYGVFVYRTKELLEHEMMDWTTYGGGVIAVGTVALWGEVIEHEKGYRAENAKILTIDKASWGLRGLQQRYGLAPPDPPPPPIDLHLQKPFYQMQLKQAVAGVGPKDVERMTKRVINDAETYYDNAVAKRSLSKKDLRELRARLDAFRSDCPPEWLT